MSGFTRAEIEYPRDGRLGRPRVVPAGFRYNPELGVADIRGRDTGRSKKFRDVARKVPVAFVVDAVPPPWRARGVKVRGRAEALGGVIRVLPGRIAGRGLGPSARTGAGPAPG